MSVSKSGDCAALGLGHVTRDPNLRRGRVLYVALTIPMTRITDWVARRQGWYGTVGGAVL